MSKPGKKVNFGPSHRFTTDVRSYGKYKLSPIVKDKAVSITGMVFPDKVQADCMIVKSIENTAELLNEHFDDRVFVPVRDGDTIGLFATKYDSDIDVTKYLSVHKMNDASFDVNSFLDDGSSCDICIDGSVYTFDKVAMGRVHIDGLAGQAAMYMEREYDSEIKKPVKPKDVNKPKLDPYDIPVKPAKRKTPWDVPLSPQYDVPSGHDMEF